MAKIPPNLIPLFPLSPHILFKFDKCLRIGRQEELPYPVQHGIQTFWN